MTDSSIPKFFEKSHEEKLDIICNFSDLNDVFKEYFPEKPPARSIVQVSALPMGARIEIEAVGTI